MGLPWKPFQAFPLRLADSYNSCFGEQSQSVSQATEKKKDQARERKAKIVMCVRYTLLIANSLLALLGLLLLAGGVWRIVDDESLREVAKDIQDTQEWEDVKGEVTGLEDAVKEA